jgi:hypothetical protein
MILGQVFVEELHWKGLVYLVSSSETQNHVTLYGTAIYIDNNSGDVGCCV